MTADPHTPHPNDQDQAQGGEPRPALERIAAAYLAREVDHGERLDPRQLAEQLSVSRAYTTDLLRLLRAHRQRDPQLAALRMVVVRDRIQRAYLTRELRGGQPLDAAALAAEVDCTPAVARQWLHGLRTSRQGDPRLAGVRAEPAAHGQPTQEQLAALQAHFAAGGAHTASLRPGAAGQLAERLEARYWAREVRHGLPWAPGELARQVGTSSRQAAQALRALRAGPATVRARVEQLWWQQEVAHKQPLSPTQLAGRLASSPSYVRSVIWQLRVHHGAVLPRDQAAAVRQRLADLPATSEVVGEGWRAKAACREVDPELFFPQVGQTPQATRAKQVCAGCQVRGACLQAALQGPLARDDRHGIFAGTTPRERQRLRGGRRRPPPPASSATGTWPSRRWRWPTRSASTGPPSSWACPSRRCGTRLPSMGCRSRPSTAAAPPPPACTKTSRRPPPRSGGPPRWASTRPARSWASPTGRCVTPGATTGWACHPQLAAAPRRLAGRWTRRSCG